MSNVNDFQTVMSNNQNIPSIEEKKLWSDAAKSIILQQQAQEYDNPLSVEILADRLRELCAQVMTLHPVVPPVVPS